VTDRLDAHPLAAVCLDDVVLLPPGDDARRAVSGVAVAVDASGVTLASTATHVPRVLPWSALETYVVEPVDATPARWWEDPELRDPEDPERGGPEGVTPRPAPPRRRQDLVRGSAAQRGSLVSLRTAAGTYRLLVPGADSDALAARLRPLAAAHLPPEALPTVTTAVRPAATPAAPTTWQRVRPVLAVLAAVLAAAAITVILLQSAGAVHLPFLGGTGPTAFAPPDTGPTASSALSR
jgi:hypothetical protein